MKILVPVTVVNQRLLVYYRKFIFNIVRKCFSTLSTLRCAIFDFQNSLASRVQLGVVSAVCRMMCYWPPCCCMKQPGRCVCAMECRWVHTMEYEISRIAYSITRLLGRKSSRSGSNLQPWNAATIVSVSQLQSV